VLRYPMRTAQAVGTQDFSRFVYIELSLMLISVSHNAAGRREARQGSKPNDQVCNCETRELLVLASSNYTSSNSEAIR
jgi:hypothetical protein